MPLIFIVAIIVICDQLSKYAVNSYIQTGESIPLIDGILHFTHVENAGAAFGIMQEKRYFILAAHIILVVAAIVFYKHIRREGLLSTIASALILGGAIGNMIDRLSTGYVVDFIDIRIWPVFNLADSAITIGVIMLGFYLIFSSKDKKITVNGNEQDGKPGRVESG